MKTIAKLALIGASALTLTAGAAAAQPMPYGAYPQDSYAQGRYEPGRYEGGYEHRGDGRYDQGRYGQGRWMSINQRQAQLERRIERGIQVGGISRREAFRLRAEFRDIARLEDRYRYNGLSNWERADLDRRFDILSSHIRAERDDDLYTSGYGYGYRR